MTTSSTDLDTLIADLTEYHIAPASLTKKAAKALTDLRTERDALAAVVEEARTALETNERHASDDRLERVIKAKWVLATAPTTALADRDARILEEAADAWHEPHDPSTYAVGDWLTARAASRRRKASPQPPKCPRCSGTRKVNLGTKSDAEYWPCPDCKTDDAEPKR